MSDQNIKLAALYRELLGNELANKIEFEIGFHLSDLSDLNGYNNLLEKDNKKLLSKDDTIAIHSAVLTLDFEGDELNTLPLELVNKLFPAPDLYLVKRKKPYLRVIECK